MLKKSSRLTRCLGFVVALIGLGTASGFGQSSADNLNRQCNAAYQARQYGLALNLCQRAVDMGDRDALLGLALIYRLGLNQCSRAVPYYNSLLDTRPIAAVGLGEMYWMGCPDFPTNYAKARELFLNAANRGHWAGWEDLGWMDELGLGAAHNRQKAIQDFSEAVRRSGDSWANDLLIALQTANASRTFHSARELGQYAADVRFNRALAAYQRENGGRSPNQNSVTWQQMLHTKSVLGYIPGVSSH
jgi:TPR repeat protein